MAFNKDSSKKVFGFIILILTVLFGTVFSGAIFRVIELDYSLSIFVKYVLLFLPMSLAICLFAFLLIPGIIDSWTNKKIKGLLLVISVALFFFIGFLVDTLFTDFELAGIMGFFGLLFGLSYLFLGNFWIVYIGVFITILVNTLADNKYGEYQYWVVIISTLLSLTIIGFDLLRNRKKTLNNKQNNEWSLRPGA